MPSVRARRIPPNLFGVAFGLAGLAGVWQAAVSIATWSFTFSYAIVAEFALEWIRLIEPADATAWSSALVALITILVGGIAVRTITALARGQFLATSA